MEEFEVSVIQMELKYCERCGGLWLRPRGSDIVFCFGCAREMAGLERNTRSLAHGSEIIDTSESSFWTEGGNA